MTPYPTDEAAKAAIIEVGRRLYAKNFVAANDGNITCKVSPGTLWATPTGVSKGFMAPEMLIKVDLAGNVLAGEARPSSELGMHLRVYNENPAVAACVHAHPPVATAFAIGRTPLDKPILPEAVVQLGVVPVAPYATPGTPGVADAIAPFCRTHNAVLLANHGALAWGASLGQAFMRLEEVEYYALLMVYCGYGPGPARLLSHAEVDELVAARARLGVSTGGRPA